MKNVKENNVFFTDAEKEACMPLIHKLLGFSIAARKNGLLILDPKFRS